MGEYRVKKKNRCKETYKPSGGAEVRCTKEKGHKGRHVCQLQNGPVLEAWGSKPDNAEIRFLDDSPAFVGTDRSSYGPFEEGDKAVIPFDNAWVLVKRGSAEWVEENLKEKTTGEGGDNDS